MIPKIWGYEKTLHAGLQYWMKELTFVRGASGSLHYHKEKDETWYVTEGTAEVELLFATGKLEVRTPTSDPEQILRHMLDEGVGARRLTLTEGDTLNIPTGVAHRVTALSDEFTFIEASMPHSDEDVFRLIHGKAPSETVDA
jgi:mannose-6-phosphate isomerase-like protein (cupin superfamily)